MSNPIVQIDAVGVAGMDHIYTCTTKDGKTFESYMNPDSYKMAMLLMKLIKNGADERDLEEYGQLKYDEGSEDGYWTGHDHALM